MPAAPEAAIVILLEAEVIVIPVPWVKVAAAGAPALLPTTICPSVNASHVGTPVALVDKEALLVVARPVTVLAELAYKMVDTPNVSA
jgi:hypothetical protein